MKDGLYPMLPPGADAPWRVERGGRNIGDMDVITFTDESYGYMAFPYYL